MKVQMFIKDIAAVDYITIKKDNSLNKRDTS